MQITYDQLVGMLIRRALPHRHVIMSNVPLHDAYGADTVRRCDLTGSLEDVMRTLNQIAEDWTELRQTCVVVHPAAGRDHGKYVLELADG